jgi:propanediol utilization protein
MHINDEDIDLIVDKVISSLGIKCAEEKNTIPVEASGRHAHLSQEHIDMLFGKDYKLSIKRELSQPGQYLSGEKITLIGPKGTIQNISVLGPARNKTQVEISKTDALILGIKGPVRESGNISGSGTVVLATPNSVVKLEEGLIIAKRHIHFTPEDAKRFNVKDKEIVGIEIISDRSVIFKDVAVRVSPEFKTSAHIDYDEANACSFVKGTEAKIIKLGKDM